jgi:hypothetical protein
MAVHGVPRYTKDLDIWIDMSEEDAVKIMQVLQDFGFGSVGLQASDFLNPQAVIQLGYEPNRIDLLTNLDGVDFQTAKPQAVQATFAGRTISVISKHHLIINKRTVSRPRDLVDAAELEAI